jgi:Mrp family chromosome partitioning ATPase
MMTAEPRPGEMTRHAHPFSPEKAMILRIAPEILEEQLIVGFDSSDGRSRAFNLLRTQLNRYMEERGARMIGVTSATPAAGKTFLSANLSAAMSQIEDRKIILCDFDLRRGSVMDRFQCNVPIDLSKFLTGEEDDWTKALYRVNSSNLFIMPTIASMRGSSELLSSKRFAHLIAGLRALPDEYLIMCDLPPVFANDDTMLSMRELDGYLMVVDHGRSTKNQIKEAIAMLQPSTCIGTVLNRYQGGFGDEYGYGYGDTYGLKEYGRRKRKSK